MKQNKYETKRPILLTSIQSKGALSTPDRVLIVFETGEVFCQIIKKDRNDYLFATHAEARNHQPGLTSATELFEKSNNKLKFFDCVVHSQSKTSIECIYIFKPISKKREIRAQVSTYHSLLLIYGMMQNNVPSFGVFRIIMNDAKQTSLKLIYADSILGMSDVAFHLGKNMIFGIPRGLQSTITFIEIPEVIPTGFNHRMIPRILLGCHTAERQNHISACTTISEYQFVTWSDSEIPEIIFWKLGQKNEELQWFQIQLKFSVPVFIRQLVLDPIGTKIGMVLETNDETMFCIWEMYESSELMQSNFAVKDIGTLLSGCWGKSLSANSGDSFIIMTTNGMYEHLSSSIIKRDQPPIPFVTFYDESLMTRLYCNMAGELHIVKMTDNDPTMGPHDVEATSMPPFDLEKNEETGVCDGVVGMHLHRCGNCKMPLLFPLISESDDGKISNCYCCRKCQKEHWPIYYATHQPISFESVYSEMTKEANSQSPPQ